MIKFKDVTKTYIMGKNKYEALKGINFEVHREELVAIVGPSGSGKSTMMNIIGLLDRPTTGVYTIDDEDTAGFSSNQTAELRNRTIGFVFQSFFLLPRLSAIQNVGLPLHYRGESAATIKKISRETLEKVGMAEHSHHKPNELSGGQQQRVAIARALVGKPKLILADEPTGALDSKTSEDVLNLLIDLNDNEKATVIIITHDTDVAKQCKRVIEIYDGMIRK